MTTKAGSKIINAAVVRGSNQRFTFEDVRIDAPEKNEVLVRIKACGLSHIDIGCRSEGAILGHEGAGIVEQVGQDVTSVKPGDHVLLSYQSCGACPACDEGRPAECAHFSTLNLGFSRLDGSSAYPSEVKGHFFGQSSFASHALVTERNLIKIDPSLPLSLLAPLGCGMQTGAGTVFNSLNVQPGQSVLVMGVGPVGLAAIMAAKVAGATTIIAVDQHASRLKLAQQLGATEVIDADSENELITLCPSMDYVIDTTGISHLAELGRDVLKNDGIMVTLTKASSETLSRGRKVIGVIQGDAVPQTFIPKLIALWQAGQFPLEALISEYPITDINQAVTDMHHNNIIKAVLKWDEAS